jgi:hypothetical protein
MIDSVKDLRFVPNKRLLVNTLNGGYKVIEIDGTLYWPYRSKAEGHDPTAGEPFGVTMANDPTMNDDHEAKYEFLAGPGCSDSRLRSIARCSEAGPASPRCANEKIADALIDPEGMNECTGLFASTHND